MRDFAFVFPGQGSQYVGMARELAASSAAAAAVINEADVVLDEPLSRLMFDGPAEQLNETVNSQPAILAHSIALLRALEERLAGPGADAALTPAFYAGHSMGQYSAMVAAGVISLADGLRLVRERGLQMQASAEGGSMAAIIGLPDEKVAELDAVGKALGQFTIANRNSPTQIVISGDTAAVDGAVEAAKSLGARRAIVLPISVASHSPLMARAAEGMRAVLADVEFRTPTAPLIANEDARPLSTGEECRAELVDHLTLGVDWVASVEYMAEHGVSAFIEIGPGKVLSGLIRHISHTVGAAALDDHGAHDGITLPDFLAVTTIQGASA